MLAKRLIPCLDVKTGRVVKNIHFINLIDAGDPTKHIMNCFNTLILIF